MFPHYKDDEQPSKKQKKSYFPKRKESENKNAVEIVKSVSQLGCVSQDSDALVSQGRRSRRNPMHKVLGTIQRVRFTKSTQRQASIRERKDHRLKDTTQTSTSAKSLRYDFLGQISRRDCKTTAMRPKQVSEPSKNIYKLKENEKRYILLARGRMGTRGCVNKRARRKSL